MRSIISSYSPGIKIEAYILFFWIVINSMIRIVLIHRAIPGDIRIRYALGYMLVVLTLTVHEDET